VSLAPELPGTGAARDARESRHAAPALLSLATKRPDLVEVSSPRRVLGYIEVVEHLFVVLIGTRYDIAVEIGQTHDFTRALTVLQEGTPDVDA
jgi:hypothetical protein